MKRKSLGELDVSSFLSSLGNDDAEDDDDAGGFYDAKANLSMMTRNDQSFHTAFGDEDGDEGKAEAHTQLSAKKRKAVKAAATPKAEPPLSAIKKVREADDDEVAEERITPKKKAKESKKEPTKVKFDFGEANGGSKQTVPERLTKKQKAAAAANDEDKTSGEEKQKMKRKDTPAKPKHRPVVHEDDAEESEEEIAPDVEDDDDDEEEEHRKQLEELKEKDPEFYKHLKDEASDLLDFGADEDEEMEDEDEEMEEDNEEEDDEDDEEHAEQQADLTISALKKLEARALRGDAASTRKLIRAFKNGVQSGFAKKGKKKTRKQQEAGEFDDDNERAETRALEFTVAPEVYERLVSVTLTRIAAGLQVLLWPANKKTEDAKNEKKSSKRLVLSSSSPHFNAHKMKIKQLLSCFSRILLSRDTSPNVVQHLLLALRLFIGHFASIPVEGKRLLSVLVTLWSRTETEGAARIASFFRIRQLCDASRAQFLETALKDMYVAFARGSGSAKSTEVRERIAVQARCLVEVYGMDYAVSYRIGFQHIRQLALHVRSAMASKSLESLQSVCSWQFVHCLRLWALVLATHGKNGQGLQELRFPTIQVALGILSLVSTSRYNPLRLHCVEVINRICDEDVDSDKAPLFAPVSIHLLHMLRSSDLIERKIVPATDPPPELSALLKLKEDQIRKASTRLVLIPRICDLLRAHLKQHRSSVAFPELWVPMKTSLLRTGLVSGDNNNKRKSDSGEAWRLTASKVLKELIDECDAWAAKVKEAREGRNPSIKRPGGPSNLDGCDKFQRAMREQFENQEEKTLSKKLRKEKTSKINQTKEQESVEDALFPTTKDGDDDEEEEKIDLEQTVESILTEAAQEMTEKNQIADEEDRETVKKLNPKDFL